MDVERAEAYFNSNFPGKKVIRLPEDNPTEMICEVEPTEDHPDHSVAVAIIENSDPHYHRSKETYEILEGTLNLIVSGRQIELEPGETYTIRPGQVHSASGKDAIARVTSRPGWTQEDHKLFGTRR